MKVIETTEATAVIADYFDLICDTDYAFDESEILRRMNANAVDAEPVQHGKWIDIDEQTYTWKVRCSCCGNERSMMSTQGKYPNYCEACGARMDKE